MSNPRVLVVDDESQIRRFLKITLEVHGYEVALVSNGHQALELAVRELPNVIVLDVRMPDLGGLAALRQLKETEATKAIPVIIVTVNDDRVTYME